MKHTKLTLAAAVAAASFESTSVATRKRVLRSTCVLMHRRVTPPPITVSDSQCPNSRRDCTAAGRSWIDTRAGMGMRRPRRPLRARRRRWPRGR